MTEEESAKVPQWLTKLEEQRERRLKAKLGHETGAGAPCTTCGDKCPGLDLHFWRKICKNCKCGKESHLVVDDDIYGYAQFQLLGNKSSAKKFVLPGKKEEVDLEWTPKGSTKAVEKYLGDLPPELLPVKGTEGAQLRKQRLVKQMPAHDIDPALCHALSEDEIAKFLEYVAHIKEKSVGQGHITQLNCGRGQMHSVNVKSGQLISQKLQGEIASSQNANMAQLATADALSRKMQQHMVLNPNNMNSMHEISDQYPLDVHNKLHDLKYDAAQDAELNNKYKRTGIYSSESDPGYGTGLQQKQDGTEYVGGHLGGALPHYAPGSYKMYENPQNPVNVGNVRDVVYEGNNQKFPYKPNSFNQTPRGFVPNPNASILEQLAGVGGAAAGDPEQYTRYGHNLPKLPSQYIQNAMNTNRGEPNANNFGAPAPAGTNPNWHSYNPNDNAYVAESMQHPSDLKYKDQNQYVHQQNQPGAQINWAQQNYTHPQDMERLANMPPGSHPHWSNKDFNQQQHPSDSANVPGFDASTHPGLHPTAGMDPSDDQNRNYQSRPNWQAYNPNSNSNIPEHQMNPSAEYVGPIRDVSYPTSEIKSAVYCNEDAELPPPPQLPTSELPKDLDTNSNEWIIPSCHKCKKLFEPEEIVISIERTDSLWHTDCFRCETCHEILADLVYFYHKKTDSVYCGRDYAQIKGIPRCGACDELIFVQEYCLAEGSTFHVKHFCCFECDTPLAGQNYVMEGTQPLCLPCYDTCKAARCHTCKDVIHPDQQGAMVKDVHFHVTPECFSCICCKKDLIGAKLMYKNDNLFCSGECFQKFKA